MFKKTTCPTCGQPVLKSEPENDGATGFYKAISCDDCKYNEAGKYTLPCNFCAEYNNFEVNND